MPKEIAEAQDQQEAKAAEKGGAEPKKETPKAEPKYTDEDLDNLINRAIAKERKKADEEKKKITEAQKLEKMNEDEKRKYELETLQKENAKLQATLDFNEQKKIARATLSEANINIKDELLDMIVSSDADKTKASVDAFKTCFQDAVNAGIQAELKREVPKAEPAKKGGKSAGALYAEKHNAKYKQKSE